MDPSMITLIAQAVGPLLATFFSKAMEGAATRTGEMGAEKAEALLALIHDKVDETQDDAAIQTVQRFEKEPDLHSRQQDLAALLVEMGEADPEFAEVLTQRVEDLKREPEVSQFLTQVSGNARVDKITNIGSARDVHF